MNNEDIDDETIKDVIALIDSNHNPLVIEIERNGEKKIFHIDNNANEYTPIDQHSEPRKYGK